MGKQGYDKREREVRAIIRRIQAGDDNALSDLLPFYTDLIWQHVHMRFGDADDDAYASGMFRLWREARRHNLHCGAKFITLLKRGLINEMISVWKRRMTPKHRQGLLIEDAFRSTIQEHGKLIIRGRLTDPSEHEDRQKDEEIVLGHERRISHRFMVEGERDDAAA